MQRPLFLLTLSIPLLAACQPAQAPPPATTQAAAPGFTSVAAVSGERGGQDPTGPYEVVPDWPKPLSQLDRKSTRLNSSH